MVKIIWSVIYIAFKTSLNIDVIFAYSLRDTPDSCLTLLDVLKPYSLQLIFLKLKIQYTVDLGATSSIVLTCETF